MSLWLATQPLVLASRSVARRSLLEAAGIPTEASAVALDERALEARGGDLNASQVANLLAEKKACAAAAQWPGRIVVGADQTLALNARRFNKPCDRASARDQLRTLAGHSHELHSAVVVASDQQVLFGCVQSARLTMRAMSDQFIETYLDTVGSQALTSVGSYQLEGLGIHLFECIEGDHFTILGLPLLPLLAFLRRMGLLAG
jgi:septum formation protein